MRDAVGEVFGSLERVDTGDAKQHSRLRSDAVRRLVAITPEELAEVESAAEALERAGIEERAVCPRCSHSGHRRVQSRGLYQCSGCRYQVSLTAGTILASTKLPLRTWFLAMYLMTQTKNGISAVELSRQLSVSYNTAWKVKHKLMQVLKERDDTRPLGGWVQLDDAYWGGERRGGKSGRGAPGKTPFIAAVELNAEGRPMRMRLSRVGGFRRDEIEAWARCHLEPGTVVVSDGLGCFRAVQPAGCIHQPFVTGSGPQSAQHPALTWVNMNRPGFSGDRFMMDFLRCLGRGGCSP
ncbi:MAG: IS1595 family transposase [Immundisolibacterales bacterium]|nr:IS1595 family transposase [Immundisolibacterales bacterium]